jgi:hypothetical protein
MKRLFSLIFTLYLILSLNGQGAGLNTLEDLEKSIPSDQDLKLTATTKTATRLFREKDDLTTVIMIVPKGSEVSVIGSDSTYFHVKFEESDGYIFRRQATLNEAEPDIPRKEPVIKGTSEVQALEPGISRFTYLENKYGTSMASKLIAGKIWKGMNSEMIRDSWGNAQKINRVISGNTVKEEWIYKNTWLYIENDILEEWGPIRN